MSLLEVLSNTVDSLQSTPKDFREEAPILGSSPSSPKRAQRNVRKKLEVQEILDSKSVEGNRWYLVKYKGQNPSGADESSWQPYESLDCESLIQEYEEGSLCSASGSASDEAEKRQTANPINSNSTDDTNIPESTKRNLEAVREALTKLGGRAFGGQIVDWLYDNKNEMTAAIGRDKKKIRYCVNGLLSARVNSSIFEKRSHKENGIIKTEWFLADSNIGSVNSYKRKEVKMEDEEKLLENSEDSYQGMESVGTSRSIESNEYYSPSKLRGDNSSASNSPVLSNNSKLRRSARTQTTMKNSTYRSVDSSHNNRLQQVILEEKVYLEEKLKRKRSLSKEEENSDDKMDQEEEDYFDKKDNTYSDHNNHIDEDLLAEDPDSHAPANSSDNMILEEGNPQTYRGMIKAALEHLGGFSTFDNISKFIGTKFQDQLTNKAETWKHSIAGCLSVYFARKEEKDPTGKVIWTLDPPPKPKRRGKKRDRDDTMTTITYTNSSHSEREYSKGKRMVSIPLEQLESLEEEIESMKLLVGRKRREEVNDMSNNFCECCHERRDLSMLLNPCGHLFCGNIFCSASTSDHCLLCNSIIIGRLPLRKESGKPVMSIINSAPSFPNLIRSTTV